MPRTSPPSPEAVRPQLPLFDGFPFLATRLIPAGCHITLLPDRWSRPQLLALLEQQVAANRFDAALVLSADEAHYRWPADPRVVMGPAPRSTAIFIGGLLTREPLDPEMLGDRPQRLRAFSAGVNHGGILFGDLQKGGRTATPDESARLRGRGPDGVPLGLHRCSRCGDWGGACLDPNPQFPDWLVPVHCRCDNLTRCARCLEPFRERRVWGNEYREFDGQVWHWPGFMALGHPCPLVDAWDALPNVAQPAEEPIHPAVREPIALVYGDGPGGLVFAERWRVHELLAFRRARTWGEFRLGAPTLYAEASASRDETPDDDATLNPCDISGYEDGDFPWFLQQLILDLLPESVQETYGTVVETLLNGPMLQLDPEHEAALVTALEHAGFTCHRDQDVMNEIYA